MARPDERGAGEAEQAGMDSGYGSASAVAAAPPESLTERWFNLSARGTNVSTEVRAGLTTFMVMSYIIVVNAGIISTGATIAGQDVPFAALVTSTCLVAGIMCAAMGLAANVPFAMAPGMGL
ncbi:MAG: NCS2 family permease, partial [Chloroflexota bacterium]